MAKTRRGNAIAHGGALRAAMQSFGGVLDDWLDLSTGINPNPAPIPDMSSSVFQRLPEAHHYDQTLAAARGFYKASSVGLLAAGTQAIIAQIPSLMGGQKAQILGPTYGEYARVLTEANVDFDHVTDLAEFTQPWCFVINPDNPSGRSIDADALLSVAKKCAERGGCLVVDEAFGDMDHRYALTPYAGMEGLLVFRSFGKFFGLAGIRLAAAFGEQTMIETIKRHIGPWPVSGPALAIAHHLFQDQAAHEMLRQSISQSHDITADALRNAGLEIIGDGGLFLTIRHRYAHRLHEGLKRQYVLTRIFDYQPEWLRFGLCKNEQEVKILIQRLKAVNQALNI